MNRVSLYIVAISTAALIAAALLFVAEPAVDPRLRTAALCFAVLGLVAHTYKFQLPTGASGSIGFIPFLTAAALAPNWIAVALLGAAVAIGEALLQRPPVKAVFNVAQHSLSISLAILAYRALGGTSLIDTRGFSPLAFLALFVVFLATNTVAVSGAVGISENRSIWKVWQQNTLRSITYDLFSLPVVYAFTWTYAQLGVVGAIGLAIPLLGARQLYKTNWQLEQINQELLQLMVAAIEARDPYTSGHSKRVARYAKIIARALGLSSRQVERIGVAALLHDVGKIHEIYAPILRKPDRLTADELAIMQTHSMKSAELVQNVSQLRDVVAAIRGHHENWDGSGYPDSLAGEEIPLAARIIMVADTIDAMTSDRPYRSALGPDDVRAELARLRGKQFDPGICDTLLSSTFFGQIFASATAAYTPRYLTAVPKRA